MIRWIGFLLVIALALPAPGSAARPPPTRKETRDNLVALVRQGRLRTKGRYRSRVGDIRRMFRRTIPERIAGWNKKRILIYAHGGMVGTYRSMFQLVRWRKLLLRHEVYPVIISWRTGFRELLRDAVVDGFFQRPPPLEGDVPWPVKPKGWDGRLEPWIRRAGGKAVWDTMKSNGILASTAADGGARVVAEEIARLVARDPEVEIHLVGHSAGAVILGPFVDLLSLSGSIEAGPLEGHQGFGVPVRSCTLWAAACNMGVLEQCYLKALREDRLGHLTLVHLSDRWERKGTVSPLYRKSILYLVGNALEDEPFTPVAGMQKVVEEDPSVLELEARGRISMVVAPNRFPLGDPRASRTKLHQKFEYDRVSILSLVAGMNQRAARP